MASTVLRFRIMPPLYQLNQAKIAVASPYGVALLSFTIIDSGLSLYTAHGSVTIIGDDLGALHNTLVEVEFPVFMDPTETSIKDDGSIQHSELHRLAVSLLNLTIEHYRVAAGATWLRRIPLKHAASFEFTCTDDQGRGRKGFWGGAIALRPSGEPSSVDAADPVIVTKIQEHILAGPVPLWLSLFIDARAELDSDNIRSGLAHLYMAFEMLATITCDRLGQAVAGRQAIDEFLDPQNEKGHPTIYQVVKQCRDWAASGPSKNALSRKLSYIWKYRNDILHGRNVRLPDSELNKTVTGFRDLIQWLATCSPKT